MEEALALIKAEIKRLKEALPELCSQFVDLWKLRNCAAAPVAALVALVECECW